MQNSNSHYLPVLESSDVRFVAAYDYFRSYIFKKYRFILGFEDFKMLYGKFNQNNTIQGISVNNSGKLLFEFSSYDSSQFYHFFQIV